jgi:hypothetical protein
MPLRTAATAHEILYLAFMIVTPEIADRTRPTRIAQRRTPLRMRAVHAVSDVVLANTSLECAP